MRYGDRTTGGRWARHLVLVTELILLTAGGAGR
jgi:hypothetical protein